MNEETLKNIEKSLTDKITKINDAAVKKVNKLLNAYGLQAKMQIVLEEQVK